MRSPMVHPRSPSKEPRYAKVYALVAALEAVAGCRKRVAAVARLLSFCCNAHSLFTVACAPAVLL